MRLNQLLFADETSLGLIVVAGLIIVDVYSFPHFGGLYFLWILQVAGGASAATLVPGRGQTETAVTITQLGLLFALSVALGWRRIRRSNRRLSPLPVAQIDPVLAGSTARLGRVHGAGSAIFAVTGDMSDCNAFCQPAGSRVRVILGGGLRLLVRKKTEMAAAVIVHECAHVARKDVWLMVFVRQLFQAFLVLALFNAGFSQLWFWLDSLAKLILYLPPGMSVRAALAYFSVPLLNVSLQDGLYPLTQALLLGLFLGFFLREREFMADEVCSISGLRSPLAELLAMPRPFRPRSLLQAISAFHPSAAARLERVRDASSWGKISWKFCFAAAALSQLLNQDNPFDSGLFDFLLFALATFFICNHFYRTSFVRFLAGASFFQRACDAGSVWLVTAAGTLAGQCLSGESMIVFARLTVNYMVRPGFRQPGGFGFSSLLAADVGCIVSYQDLLFYFLLSALLIVPYSAKRFRPSKAMRIAAYVVVMIGAVGAVSAILGICTLGIPGVLGWNSLGNVDFSNGLNWKTLQPFWDSYERAFFLICSLGSAFMLAYRMINRATGRSEEPSPRTHVHPERLAPE